MSLLRASTITTIVLATAPSLPALADVPSPVDGYRPDERAAIYALSPLPAPPRDSSNRVAADARAARLGQYLFFDLRLSGNGKISCATCHQPGRAFTDGRPVSLGLATGTRNAPTLIGVRANHWFFWDGRADSLWSQVLQVVESPIEMGGDRSHVAQTIYHDAPLRQAYEAVFGYMPPLADAARFPRRARPDPDGQSEPAQAWRAMAAADRKAVDRVFSNAGKAIEAYERLLVGGNSPFDRYVAALRSADHGRKTALSRAARRGLQLFVGAAHCSLCHSGPGFSDGEFHNIGLPQRPGSEPDGGRADGIRKVIANPFNGIGAYSDDPTGTAKDRLEFLPPPDPQLGKFRTPTLRNVALTGPYMHDGRFNTLPEVLAFYASGKAADSEPMVGQREQTLDLIPHLTPRQISDLIAFLGTLTDAPLPPSVIRRARAP
jgi:cytochrome c peroxidase